MDWKEEVESDLASALRRLDALAPEISGSMSGGQLRELWRCYLSVEKCVAFVKLELDEEGGARFVNRKAYTVPDDRQAVSFAAGSLRAGLADVRAGSLSAGLRSLRDSRNYLRMLLRRRILSSRRPSSNAS